MSLPASGPWLKVLSASLFLRKHLAALAFMAVALGLAVGSRVTLAHPEVLIQAAIFVMIFPLLLGIETSELAKAAANRKVLAGSILLNFALSPLLGLILARAFLAGEGPEFAAGFVLFATVPCGNMGGVYTSLAGGDVALTVGIMGLSFILDLFLVPLVGKLAVGRFVPVPVGLLAEYLVWVLAAPFLAAWVSRRAIRSRWGEEMLGLAAEGAMGLTAFGLAFVVFIISALKAQELIARPQVFLKLLLCVPLLMAMLTAAAFVFARVMRMRFEEFATLAVTSATKNAALALALATVAFGPEAALPIAMGGPFLQVPGVLLLARFAPRLKRVFPEGSTVAPL